MAKFKSLLTLTDSKNDSSKKLGFGLLANDVQTAGKYSINVMDSYLLSKCFELKLSSSRLNLST